MDIEASQPTIVLVHGAVEDSSLWTHGVIQRLLRDGYPFKVFSNPLRGLAVDVAYLRSLLDTIEGPVILVSHAYGGAVITQAGDDPKVKGLIYAGSPMPGVGESTNDCLERFPGGDFASSVDLIPFTLPDGTSGTNVLVKPDKYSYLLAADVPESVLAPMIATQRLGSPQRQTDIGCMDEQAELADQALAGSRHPRGRIQVRSRSCPLARH
jgi:pimeloyl-ACP methyl ester carboxylesterase